MIENILGATNHIPEALGPIRMQEGFNELPGKPIHGVRPMNDPSQNLLVDAVRSLVEERRIANEHFVTQNPACPPIRSLPMAVGLDNLRR